MAWRLAPLLLLLVLSSEAERECGLANVTCGAKGGQRGWDPRVVVVCRSPGGGGHSPAEDWRTAGSLVVPGGGTAANPILIATLVMLVFVVFLHLPLKLFLHSTE